MWDAALPYVMYYTFQYTGNINILKENALTLYSYLEYLKSRRDERGLLSYGLGDWCPPGREVYDFLSPVSVTSTAFSIDMCKKSYTLFAHLGLEKEATLAYDLGNSLRIAFRKHLIDFGNYSEPPTN